MLFGNLYLKQRVWVLRFSVFEDALAKNHTLGFLGFVIEEALAKNAALGFLCLSLVFKINSVPCLGVAVLGKL